MNVWVLTTTLGVIPRGPYSRDEVRDEALDSIRGVFTSREDAITQALRELHAEFDEDTNLMTHYTYDDTPPEEDTRDDPVLISVGPTGSENPSDLVFARVRSHKVVDATR